MNLSGGTRRNKGLSFRSGLIERMSDLTDRQRVEIWRHSIPLARAPLYFASPDTKQKYATAHSNSALDAMQNATMAGKEKEGLEAFKVLFEEPTRIVAERSAATEAIRSGLVKYGKSGAVRAIGFQPPRKIEDVPVSVPTGAWKGSFDWDRSRLIFQSIEFIEVRVTTDKIWQQVAAKFSSVNKSRGRPSTQELLLEAINEFVRYGNVDTTRSMTSHFQSIRALVQVNAKNQKIQKMTVGNETIRKVFSPIFKDLKNGKKL